ncbi:MAG TPA: hypothetical protein VIM56_14645 [Rhizomicrobium sp.]
MRSYILAAAILILGCSDWPASASPYATDDPEIVDAKSWQIALFSQENTNDNGKSGTAAGVELDYGLMRGLQASVSVPVGFSAPNRDDADLGMSHIEFGVKYAIIDDTHAVLPAISFCPSVEFSFRASYKLTDGATHFFFPVWAEKSWGAWTLRGGAGYRTNPGRGGKDSVFSGTGLTRSLTDQLQLGGEIFLETSSARGEPAATGYNLGFTYALTDRLQLGISAGSGLSSTSSIRGLNFYTGVQWSI